MMHSTHFIYGYMVKDHTDSDKGMEGNVLFNDTLNTFYLRLYGKRTTQIARKEWNYGNVLFNDALNTFYLRLYGRKEGNVLFNDALNTFYLWLYGRKEVFYLTTHSTHFIYSYMASDIWLRTILIVRKETRCCHIGFSFRLAARVLLYAPSHRQDSTYHSLCYTSHGALAGTRNSSMGPPHEGSIRRPIAP